jgi:hypothetical protein
MGEALNEPATGSVWGLLGSLARTMPVAARKARHHLEQALKGTRQVPMPGFLVRVLRDLGALSQANSRPDAARANLEEAEALAGADAPTLRHEIRRRLESLPPGGVPER